MTALCVLETAAVTAVGLASASAAAAVRCGIAGFAEYAGANNLVREPAIVAAPPGIAAFEDAALAMAEMAAAALAQLTLPGPLPVLLTLPEDRPGLGPDLAGRVTAGLAQRFPEHRISVAGGAGHAGVGVALQQVAAYLDRNPDGAVAVVGTDSYLHRDTIRWLDQNRQLHATYNAWGFIPGAAAGAALLCHPRLARSRPQPPVGVIEAFAVEREAVPIKTDGVCLGRAMSRIVDSLVAGQPEGAVFDMLYCDQNGETYRADELGFTLARTARRFRDPSDFLTPADCWGDVGAASLPLYIALATEAAARNYSRGPVSLLLAGSESGLRAGIRLRTKAGGA